MPDNELLRALGIKMPPTLPAPTPAQSQLHEQLMQRELAKKPAGKMLDSSMGALGDVFKGLVADPTTPKENLDQMSPWQKGGMLAAAAPFGIPETGIKGLYSRVGKVLAGMPEKINSSRAASLLKSGAAKEEIVHTGLDKILEKTAGKTIPTAMLQEQHAKQPLKVKVQSKGGPVSKEDLSTWFYHHYGTRPTPEDLADPMTLANYQVQQDGGTRYGSYVMDGAEPGSYREALIQLDKPSTDIDSADGNFVGQHFQEPNILAHVRHNDRRLPSTQAPIKYEIVPITDPTEAAYGLDPSHPLTHKVLQDGKPRFWGSSEASAQDWMKHGVYGNDGPPKTKDVPGPLGRMLENVQSDWHQKGSHGGYKDPDFQKRFKDVINTNDNTYLKLRDYMDQFQMDHYGTSARADALEADPTYQQLRKQVDATEAAYEEMSRRQSSGVPDAPFKTSWPELALKQQLLDVADKPDLDWIGIAPSSELRRRGEEVSPDFQDKRLPLILDKLLGPMGGKVEKVPIINDKPLNLTAVTKNASEFTNKPNRFYASIIANGQDKEPIASTWPTREFQNSPIYGPDSENLMDALQKTNPSATTEQISSFIARLTPEIKAQIKTKGFPLLALLFAAHTMQAEEQ